MISTNHFVQGFTRNNIIHIPPLSGTGIVKLLLLLGVSYIPICG